MPEPAEDLENGIETPDGDNPDRDKRTQKKDQDNEDYLEALDAIELEGDDELDLDEKEEDQDNKDKDKKSDKDKDGKEKIAKTPEELQAKIDQQHKTILNLNKGISKVRGQYNDLKKGKSEESPLTDAQIGQLFQEHKDDPETLYSLVNYMIKQGSQKAQDNAVEAAEISQRTKELNDGLVEAFPDLAKSDSELRVQVNETIDGLRLNDHPFKDFLAVSAMIHKDLEEIRKTAFEEGKKEALKENADKTRKKNATETNLTPPGKTGLKGSAGELPTNIKDVAKRLGLSKRGLEVYKNLVKKPKTMEV